MTTPGRVRAGERRIIGAPVAPLVPESGNVQVLLVGEAPGPRGADKSGYPFFGDAAGKPLYQVLQAMGAVTLPAAVAQMPWDGRAFAEAGLRPVAHGVALGNAYDRCPTSDGMAFRTPTKQEMFDATNIARLQREVGILLTRGLCGVVTMGRVAADTMDAVCASPALKALRRGHVPHPSAQGLLSMAPNRGKGARMADLQAEWMRRCRDALLAAGFSP